MPPITFIHLEETDSTNTFLKSYPRDPAQPYIAVMADYQTAGRGQRGNTWHSARGQNLLCSIRHHPTFLRPQQQFILSQLIALTITDGLSELLPDADEHLRIKWPNDIYWDDRKLCGILIEYELSATSIEQAIIGFGINVNQTDFDPAPGDTTLRLPSQGVLGSTFRPTSLRLIAAQTPPTTPNPSPLTFDIPALFHAITEHYVQSVATLQSSIVNAVGDLESAATDSLVNLQTAYVRRLYRLGVPARYRDAQGDFTATLEGVNPDGTLRLRDNLNALRSYPFKEVAYIL